MIDPDGFRPNVGIILSNRKGQLLWARRVGQDAWQFPQGGMRSDETPAEAMYRELTEEVGLRPEQVEVIGSTRGWLRYRLPRQYIRHGTTPLCIGQKQVWFLLRFLGDDSAFSLDGCEEPEFCTYQWVDFWYPADNVITFKRAVYRKALTLLEPLAESHLSASCLPGSSRASA